MKLIDIFKANGKLYAWLFNSTNSFIECEFEPELFVFAAVNDLVSLQRVLRSYGFECSLQKGKTLKGVKTVLAVKSNVSGFGELVKGIGEHGKFSYEIFNSDIPLPEYYMFVNNIFPNCKVGYVSENGKIVKIWAEDSFADEYSIPLLKQSVLSISTSHSLWRKTPPKLVSATLDNTSFEGDDVDIVKNFVSYFDEKDPDVILTQEGSIELPFLLGIIRKYVPSFSFSRFGKDSFKSEGNSYRVYGRVIYQNNGVYLKGRLHLEKKGVIYGKWNLWHDFELSRACRTSLQRINHRSTGYGITSLQMYHAMKKGFLIPRNTGLAERWKSGTELFNADRGALVYEPRVGFHTDIAEIDFISLFPSIMVNKNISTETLFCSCCPENIVPGLSFNVCLKEKGIIPEMLEPLIRQRIYYKSRQDRKDRADALKGLLVTSFGYMGFRKSKFARIESHQAIQAYAREILLDSSKIAEELGFSVMHGIVDSLWVKNPGISKTDISELIREIKYRLGFDAKLEGIYRWIVFLPSTSNKHIPVPTRYYGVFYTGEIKCRGIDLRRHDTPGIVSELQEKIIGELAPAQNYMEFRKLMFCSVSHLRDSIERLASGNIVSGELCITKSISKEKYSSSVPQAIIAEKLRQLGISPNPGQYVKYVISGRHSKIRLNRYSLDPGVYDRWEYARLARKAVENILGPFIDVSIEEKQPTLFEAIKNGDKGNKVEGLPLQVKERAF